LAEGGGAAQATGGGSGMPAVFISYASQDAAVANAVVAALEGGGLSCWIAPRDVTPGAFYGDAIVHAIDAAQAVKPPWRSALQDISAQDEAPGVAVDQP
jgi:hypothetical protein